MGRTLSKMYSFSSKNKVISTEERMTMHHRNRVQAITSKFKFISNYACFFTMWAFSAAFLFMILFAFCVLWWYTAESPTDKATNKIVLHSFHYFMYCTLAGALAGSPGLILLPIDILKCRVQVGKCKGFKDGLTAIFKFEAGSSYLQTLDILYRGWVPAACGYFMQGGIKFFLYELLKYYILGASKNTMVVGKEEKHVFWVLGPGMRKTLGILIASCVAEIVADLALAPCVAVKITTQITVSHSVTLFTVIHQMWLQNGLKTFYKALIPLWCKQVPCTVIKFLSFERIVRILYMIFNANGADGKTETHKSGFTHLSLSLLAGALSGIICAVASHPADTILSKLFHSDGPVHSILPSREDHGKDQCGTNSTDEKFVELGKCGPSDTDPIHASEATIRKHKMGAAIAQDPIDRTSKAASVYVFNNTEEIQCVSLPAMMVSPGSAQKERLPLLDLVRSLTWEDLWRGLLLRVILLALCTSLQWAIYDSIKVLVGFPTTGSS